MRARKGQGGASGGGVFEPLPLGTERALPHAELAHGAGDVGELVVEVRHHRVVDAAVVVGDRGEALLVLDGRLQRVVRYLGVVVEEEGRGLVVRGEDGEDARAEELLFVCQPNKTRGAPGVSGGKLVGHRPASP